MPYPQHVDEHHVIVNAMIMLNSDNYYPGILCYPSFPIYMTAAILKIGKFIDNVFIKSEPNSKFDLQKYPFYKEYIPVIFVKFFFCIIALFIPITLSIVTTRLCKSVFAGCLTFFFICMSELFSYHSSHYVNIDLVATLFVSINIFFFVFFFNPNSFYKSVLIPGILTGFAIASKYPLGLISIIYLLGFIFDKDIKMFHVLIKFTSIISISIITTVILCPYIFIFFDTWLNDIIQQGKIYSNGWPGYTVESGTTNFTLQVKQIYNQYGFMFFTFFLIGILFFLVKKSLNGFFILFFCLIFISYFSTYSVNLVRNLLSVYILYALISSVGFFYLTTHINKHKHRILIYSALALVTFLSLPQKKIERLISLEYETRNVLYEYIKSFLPKGGKIYISKEIGLNINKLDDYNVSEINFLNEDKKTLNPSIAKIANSKDIFVYPIFCTDMRWPDGIHFANSINQSINGLKSLLHIQGRVGGSYSYIHLSRPGVQVNSSATSPWGNPSIIVTKGLETSF